MSAVLTAPTASPVHTRVLRNHYMTVQTNLGFELAKFVDNIPNDRIILDPTFHPYYWDLNINPFIEKLDKLRDAGYSIGGISLVCWPGYIDYVDGYVATIKDSGYRPKVTLVKKTSYEGRKLPDEYSEHELRIIRRNSNNVDSKYYDKVGNPVKRKIESCDAGYIYACVHRGEKVTRCTSGGLMLDNFYTEEFAFNDSPLPCMVDKCACPLLFKLWDKDNVNQTC